MLAAAAGVVWLGIYLRSRGLEHAGTIGSAAALVLIVAAGAGLVLRGGAAAPHRDMLLMDDDGPPRVRDIDSGRLGVKPAINVDGAPAAAVPYIARDVDAAVEAAIRAGGLVILHGSSASGKTRAAVEAIAKFPDRTLWIPSSTEALEALAASRETPRDAVVWLDDIDQFLYGNALTLQVIDALCPRGRTDVAIVGTIRDEELVHFDAALASDATRRQTVQHPASRVLLQARALLVPDRLSPDEQRRAEELRTDPRIDLAIRDSGGSLIEYLAAGPQLLRRWTSGAATPAGRVGSAIVSAAVDYLRAGYRRPVTDHQLHQMYPHYLREGLRDHPDRPTFEEGLRWAREPIYNASACLIARQDGYTPHDYLLDRVDRSTPVPAVIWEAVLRETPVRGLFDVGVAAFAAGKTDVASRAFLRTVPDSLTVTSTLNLGYIENIAGQMFQTVSAAEAELWLGRAVKAGDPEALYEMGCREFRAGNHPGAAEWFGKAAAERNAAAWHGLGAVKLRTGEPEAAEQLWRTAAGLKNASAMYNLGVLLRDRDETGEAVGLWKDAARAGFPPAMHALAVELHAAGEPDEAARWWRRAALSRFPAGQYNAGVLAARKDDLAAAERWWKLAAAAGHPSATAALAWLSDRRSSTGGACPGSGSPTGG
ncbi:hypothetical protein GCM10007977_047880 [Dactylosporangium sucinum]|uniref:Sel1 repeat family protein n=1 Tax=Dactylosporangium sucinum TaxID=1424081 RepID=A0A917WYS5_9ACTN|nr:hypothetical protein GCM10007977_047880 [Dactylosporangium sucinum]